MCNLSGNLNFEDYTLLQVPVLGFFYDPRVSYFTGFCGSFPDFVALFPEQIHGEAPLNRRFAEKVIKPDHKV